MLHDPNKDGSSHRFPTTRRSAIAGIRSDVAEERSRSLAVLAEIYWSPVYRYIRLKWNREHDEATDLAQEFFASVIEKDFFARYDPTRARFRTFLRVCLDRFIANANAASGRIKRGGDIELVPIAPSEGDAPGTIDLPSGESLDDYFDHEWMRSLFSLAVARLKEQCAANGREMHFRLFERHDLNEDDEPPSYAALAEELGITVTTVTNYLAAARREFRRIVLETLREITATDEEYRLEARALLGVDVA